MRIEDLERLNEWWSTGSVRDALAPEYRRRPFFDALRLLEKRQAVVLTGLRRVGKSTILYQLIRELLRKTDAASVLYYSFEEGGESTKEVIGEYERRVLKRPMDEAGRVYVFLDEVQYSRDWVGTVKRFYDLYPNAKFYLSGSSSLLISNRVMQNLAGRFFSVEVYPVTFREFAEAKRALPGGGSPSSRLEPLFFDYMTKAGFPEIMDWSDGRLISEYVRNSVLDRVTLRDVPSLFGQRDPVLLGKLLMAVVSSPGSMANMNEFARELGASRITVSRYLRSLETSLLLRSLGNFRPSSRSTSRKLRKYYPATTSMIFSIARRAFEEHPGAVLETYVVNALRASHYYRKAGREVDVVLGGGETAVEAKVRPDERDAAKLSKISGAIGSKRRLIVSLSRRGRLSGVDVVPAYALEWELGAEEPAAG